MQTTTYSRGCWEPKLCSQLVVKRKLVAINSRLTICLFEMFIESLLSCTVWSSHTSVMQCKDFVVKIKRVPHSWQRIPPIPPPELEVLMEDFGTSVLSLPRIPPAAPPPRNGTSHGVCAGTGVWRLIAVSPKVNGLPA